MNLDARRGFPRISRDVVGSHGNSRGNYPRVPWDSSLEFPRDLECSRGIQRYSARSSGIPQDVSWGLHGIPRTKTCTLIISLAFWTGSRGKSNGMLRDPTWNATGPWLPPTSQARTNEIPGGTRRIPPHLIKALQK